MTWQIVDDYTRLNRTPGQCSKCNLSKRLRPQRSTGYERVILTGIIIDFEGNVELCETCIREVAEMLGYVTPELHEDTLVEIASLKASVAALTADVADKAQLLRGLTLELSSVLEDSVDAG